MSIISRITTWATNQLLTSSALNGEFNNVINVLNNIDAGTTPFTTLNVSSAYQFNANTILTLQQVITATSSGDTTITSATYVISGLTAVITPKSTNSKILVISCNEFSGGQNGDETDLAQFRGTTQLTALTRFGCLSTGVVTSSVLIDYDAPASVSAQTYSVKGKNNNAHGFTHYGTSNMILVEFL